VVIIDARFTILRRIRSKPQFAWADIEDRALEVRILAVDLRGDVKVTQVLDYLVCRIISNLAARGRSLGE
jgi:hypothetical protein